MSVRAAGPWHTAALPNVPAYDIHRGIIGKIPHHAMTADEQHRIISVRVHLSHGRRWSSQKVPATAKRNSRPVV